MDEKFVPTDTVLEVQDGIIDLSPIFKKLDESLDIQQEEGEDGKTGS